MNPTGCVTPLGDGAEAFVVLCASDERLPPACAQAVRHGPPSLPPPPPEPYKLKPRKPHRKDRGAFVVLPDPRPVTAAAPVVATSAEAVISSGRVSPFRGYGFKTPENGRSRAASPSGGHGHATAGQPVATNRARPPPSPIAVKKIPSTTKPPSSTPTTPNAARKKPPPSPRRGPATVSSKSPLPPRSPKPPVSPKLPGSTKLPGSSKPPGFPKPPGSPRPPKTPSRSFKRQLPPATTAVKSPRPTSAKKPPTTTPAKDVMRPDDVTGPALAPTISLTATSAAASSPAPTSPVTTLAAAFPATTPSTADVPTIRLIDEPVAKATVVAPVTAAATTEGAASAAGSAATAITASNSATAIGTTHATNTVASAVITGGGPIVTAAPPPAAIAANTVVRLSVLEPYAGGAATKPPQSATRSREPPVAVAPPSANRRTTPTPTPTTTPIPTSTTTTTKNATATTPPLSYELQEIKVEPETENQSGSGNVNKPNLAGGNKVASTSNGHKTVAWARQSEKIIEPAATKVGPAKGKGKGEGAAGTGTTANAGGSAYKRLVRKLCCSSDGGGGPVAGRRSQCCDVAKCWAAVWKRRPRLCGKCCAGRPRKQSGGTRATATAAAAETAAASGRRRWLRWLCCRCGRCGGGGIKPTKKKDAAARLPPLPLPPTPVEPSMTFCGKLKRRLLCGGCLGGRCAVPGFVRRFCCCCCCCCACCRDRSDGPSKSTGDKRTSPFDRCTGCCTDIPKLDAVFVDHSSVMKGAIPVLPVTLAWLCLVFNVIIPGSGTFSSGMLCLCVGKPRFTVNDTFQSRMGAFCVNFVVAAAQLFTVLFCLVGWGWSIWWGVIMLKMAKKYQKVKVIDQPVEAPIAIDHNHQI